MKLSDLPTAARVWVYQSDRMLTDSEVSMLTMKGHEFISTWAAHGSQLAAGFEVFENVFMVLAVDEQQAAASGCSIDTSVHFVQQMGEALKVDFFNRTNIAYICADGKLNLVSLEEFKDLHGAGHVTENTVVYNNLVQTIGDFMTSWKTRVQDSWHAQVL